MSKGEALYKEPKGKKSLSLKGWPLGQVDVVPLEETPVEALRDTQNVDLMNSGRPRTRKGFEQALAGTDVHSIWSDDDRCFYMDSGTLKELLYNGGVFSSSDLVTGMDVRAPVRFEKVNDDILFTNKYTTGRLKQDGTVTEWGIESPAGQPSLTAVTVGGLDSGLYQVAVVFISDSVEKSGTSVASTVQVVQGGGIDISSIPQPVSASVTGVEVYVSEANGSVLYKQAAISVGVTSLSIGSTSTKGGVLDTQFMAPMPPGDFIGYYNGSTITAKDKVLCFSEPFRYGLYKYHTNTYVFPDDITNVIDVEVGVFATTTEKQYLLRGKTMRDMELETLADCGAAKYTAIRMPAEASTESGGRDFVAWLGHRGVCYGLSDGRIKNITQNSVGIDKYTKGSTLYREYEGIRQVVALGSGSEQANSLKVTDRLTAQVRRNGVII